VAAISTTILAIIAYSAAYLLDPQPLWFKYVSNGMSVGWAAAAIVFFLSNMFIFGLKNRAGQVWLCLAIGLGLWFLGDLIYSIIDITQAETPYPGPADYAYIIGYPFLIFGILLQLSTVKSSLTTLEKITILSVILIYLVLGSIYVLYPLIIAPVNENLSGLEKFFSLYYPFGDLIVASLALILVFRFWGGQFSKSWLLISAGFMWSATYDLFFSYMQFLEIENYGLIMDHFYNAFYMIFAIGAAHLWASLKNAAV
jgi:hypothetical protein